MIKLFVAVASLMPWVHMSDPLRYREPVEYHAGDTSTVVAVKPVTSAAEIDRTDLVAFAQSFKGVPYKYASADPDKGFDCSGFVLYVFKHFNVQVPRSSSAFAKIGKRVPLEEAQPGDIILFTGPRSAKASTVGHVGIITEGGETISFIHASSGKAYSVVETSMTPHYQKRFVKVVRVL